MEGSTRPGSNWGAKQNGKAPHGALLAGSGKIQLPAAPPFLHEFPPTCIASHVTTYARGISTCYEPGPWLVPMTVIPVTAAEAVDREFVYIYIYIHIVCERKTTPPEATKGLQRPAGLRTGKQCERCDLKGPDPHDCCTRWLTGKRAGT